jgi:transposase
LVLSGKPHQGPPEKLMFKEGKMRIIGIDLGVTAQHRAVIANERSQFVSPIIQFKTELAALERLRARALKGAPADCPLVVVMEATNIVWYPISVYFIRHGDRVHVVNPRMSAALSRFYHQYAKSDRLAAKSLARMPLVCPESLYPVTLPGADCLALQRGCRELDRLTVQVSAIKNRLRAIDLLGWPGLRQRVFSTCSERAVRWFREHFYEPRRVVEAGEAGVREAWEAAGGTEENEEWIQPLVALATELQQLYGQGGSYLDYAALAAEVGREQGRLADLEADVKLVRLKVTRPIYRQLHPSRNLESIKGVGQDGAAVFVGFTGEPGRFSSQRGYRGWSGMVPRSAQSGEGESKGMRITQAGPNLIKKFSFLDADAGRKRDPQLAAIYYDQMVNKGKHHTQAVCACATHLLDRVRVVVTEDRPYELRDVDGTPVSEAQALTIIAQRYTVPEDVRRRNKKRARRERAERRAERREKKRSRSR